MAPTALTVGLAPAFLGGETIYNKKEYAHGWYIFVLCCGLEMVNTVKPVCNDHLYNEIYYLWFIQ